MVTVVMEVMEVMVVMVVMDQEEVILLKEVTALSLVQSLAHFVADSLEAVTLLLRRIEHLLLDRQSLAGNR